jgi:hypothetical protein
MKTIRIEKPIIETTYNNGTPMTNGFIVKSPCHSENIYFFPYSSIQYININKSVDREIKSFLTIIMKNHIYIDLIDEIPKLEEYFYNIIGHISI